jgi:hypothetical protein
MLHRESKEPDILSKSKHPRNKRVAMFGDIIKGKECKYITNRNNGHNMEDVSQIPQQQQKSICIKPNKPRTSEATGTCQAEIACAPVL